MQKRSLIVALKDLLKTLGGNSNKGNIVGVIDDINEQMKNDDGNNNGALIIDTEFIDDGGYNKYYKSSILADDIKEAFLNGQNVIVKIAGSDDFLVPQGAISLLEYNNFREIENFKFSTEDFNISNIERTNDGYLMFKIYID